MVNESDDNKIYSVKAFYLFKMVQLLFILFFWFGDKAITPGGTV